MLTKNPPNESELLAEATRISVILAKYAAVHDRDGTFPTEGVDAILGSPINTVILDGGSWSTFSRILIVLAKGDASAATAWLSAGPGVEVDGAFIGHADDLELGAAARFDIPVTSRIAITPGLGLALHIDTIRGTAPATDESAHTRRLNPAGVASLALGYDPGGGIRLTLSTDVAARLRRQTFIVAGEKAYEIAPFELTWALGVAVPLL